MAEETTVDFEQRLWEWKQTADHLRALKDKEAKLRAQLFGFFFTEPTEGTNTIDLARGWKLKGIHKINRNIDEAALPATLEELGEGMEEKLITYKPQLNMREYKKLTDEQRQTLDHALIVKPGAPTLEIVPPKKDE